MTTRDYVHGYDPLENVRLQDQAATLEELLHTDTTFGQGARVLEAGCGVGAQTVTLAKNSPNADIVAVDISSDSIQAAADRIRNEGISNVSFLCGDLLDLPFPPGSFDHVFLCFVLEHLPRPVEALVALRRMLRPGGTLTVIEGDHGSTFFHPDSRLARKAIHCQVELQARVGGNANIGRELFPLLASAGFENTNVSPRMVYVDGSKPELIEGFTKKTFTAMIQGIRDKACATGLISPEDMDRGIQDLYRTATPDGVFSYTFFKAIGRAA